ncbi:hypothetical protein N7445_005210 [Penicillium cf. griseofulvum]|nr:hypothetical protein N7445_005210 [Penicillium cf. griseofulvum]
MSENVIVKDTENERNKKWEMVFTARMRQIVPRLRQNPRNPKPNPTDGHPLNPLNPIKSAV